MLPSNSVIDPGSSIAANERQQIIGRLQRLQPWRMNIEITPNLSTGEYLSFTSHRGRGHGNHRLRDRTRFLSLLDRLFVDGMKQVRFLDCGCNAGGYCFWARERQAEIAYGFDVREHWIKQARFIKRHRTVGLNDRIQFEVLNIYDLPGKNLDPFDLVQFRGLFSLLSDPVGGLKNAADLSRDILIFASAYMNDQKDGALISRPIRNAPLHGSVESMGWLPTGPQVCGDIIRNLGFEAIKLVKIRETSGQPGIGRLVLVAAREKNRLKNLPGQTIAA